MTGRRVVFEDPTLPHQIVIRVRPGFKIAVSCNCLRTGRGNVTGDTYEPIEVRSRWDSGEAIAVWRQHMEAVNAA